MHGSQSTREWDAAKTSQAEVFAVMGLEKIDDLTGLEVDLVRTGGRGEERVVFRVAHLIELVHDKSLRLERAERAREKSVTGCLSTRVNQTLPLLVVVLLANRIDKQIVT